MKQVIQYEILTTYKSGKKKTEYIFANSEEEMWNIYDKHHNKQLVKESIIVDSFPA